MIPDQKELQRIIANAFREDVRDGDHTSLACIGPDAEGTARLLIKEPGILAGVEAALAVFEYGDERLETDVKINDGEEVQPGDVAFYVKGPAVSILTCERIALNIMQRMSGIATKTRRYADAICGTGARVIDTRKTTPGIRLLEKWAVTIGGGGNHRMGLYDMMMIKDNHIDFAGGIEQAISAAHTYLKRHQLGLAIEVETRNLDEVKQVMACGGVQRIMLDNYTPDEMYTAIALIDRQYETEASGGITLDTIRDYAETGVDYISSGALTHSAVAQDMSLKAVIRK